MVSLALTHEMSILLTALDVLIDFDSKINLLDLVGLAQEPSRELGIKVDLITMKSVNKLLKPHIEKDLKGVIKSEQSIR